MTPEAFAGLLDHEKSADALSRKSIYEEGSFQRDYSTAGIELPVGLRYRIGNLREGSTCKMDLMITRPAKKGKVRHPTPFPRPRLEVMQSILIMFASTYAVMAVVSTC